VNWFVVDRPFATSELDMADTFSTQECDLNVATAIGIKDFTGKSVADIIAESNNTTHVTTQKVTINPNQFIQYSDFYRDGGMGARSETGELQAALLDTHLAYLDLANAVGAVEDCNRDFQREAKLMLATIENHENQVSYRSSQESIIKTKLGVVSAAETLARSAEMAADYLDDSTVAISEMFPKMVGLANDALAGARGGTLMAGTVGKGMLVSAAFVSETIARSVNTDISKSSLDLEAELIKREYSLEATQLAYEVEKKYREMTGMTSAIAGPAAKFQQANERVRSVLAMGLRVVADVVYFSSL
jgi:hypothetical protein